VHEGNLARLQHEVLHLVAAAFAVVLDLLLREEPAVVAGVYDATSVRPANDLHAAALRCGVIKSQVHIEDRISV